MPQYVPASLEEPFNLSDVLDAQIRPDAKSGEGVHDPTPVGALPQAFMKIVESKAQNMEKESDAGSLSGVPRKAVSNRAQDADARNPPRDGFRP